LLTIQSTGLMNYCLGIWIYQKARAVSKVPAPDAYLSSMAID
jgi:hypothetical protein